MAITVPVTGSEISATAFGAPVANALNAIEPTAWTNVTFQNGWVNFGAPYQNVQYRKIGDIVYVRGMMKSGTINQIAFTLPAGFRPPAEVYLPTTSNAGSPTDTYATVTARIDGGMVPTPPGGNVYFNVNVSFSVTA